MDTPDLNPDVEELLRYNDDACPHPEDRLRRVTERVFACGVCGRPVVKPAECEGTDDH